MTDPTRLTAAVVLSLAVMFVWCAPARGEELRDGYFTVYTAMDQTILQTGRTLRPGDTFIDEDNREYAIERVYDRRARARHIGDIDTEEPSSDHPPADVQGGFRIWSVFQQEEEESQKVVGIYHTHSSESFVPTSGTDSREGQGDVIQVGATMADALRDQGFAVKHDSTSHDPHDAGAYTRSRRTAVSMLEQAPEVLFDVHRDMGPATAYLTEIDGDEVARILLVVGRANPHQQANLSFAQALKNQADEKYPGLVKGILKAGGDYNQDLGPRVLLLEIGSAEITLEHAQDSGEMMADVLGDKMAVDEPEERAAWRSALLILVVVLLGGGAFLWVSTGSWEEARARLGQYLPWTTRGRAR